MSIPGFTQLREIARCGLSRIYQAREQATDRSVCLEVMSAMPGEHPSILLMERRRQQLEVVALLDHPNVWPTFRVGEYDSTLYVVRPWYEGDWLQEELRMAPIPFARALRWVGQLARGLQYVHDHGIIHRDVKPGNVFLRRGNDGECVPLLHGFDVAAIRFLPPGQESYHEGMIVGTPAYLAPEQVMGQQADVGPLLDVWGLGVVLYEMLANRTPYRGDTVIDLIRAVVTEEPVPLMEVIDDGAVDADLQRLCMKCLRKKPQERYASAAEFADAIDGYLRGERSPVAVPPASLTRRLGGWVRGWMGARQG